MNDDLGLVDFAELLGADLTEWQKDFLESIKNTPSERLIICAPRQPGRKTLERFIKRSSLDQLI